jgi:tRNA (guanine37-N1)-methyltransferase
VRIDVLSIFPGWFAGPFTTSILGKAAADGRLDLRVHDLRAWATDRHRTVDDAPYGGGAGMVMRADVWLTACEAVWNDLPVAATAGRTEPPADVAYAAGGLRPRTLLLTPRGRPLTQAYAGELAAEDRLVLLCGRYEGIDERVHELAATDEVSVGDYVLFGGEVAAAVVVEAVTRLVPGVVGNDTSPLDESFTSGLLEYPHYTRPAEVRGRGVPAVLTSGDHGAVARWRQEEARQRTRRVRPDLVDPRPADPRPADPRPADPGLPAASGSSDASGDRRAG